VVVDCEEVTALDSTGTAALSSFLGYARRYEVDLRLARVHSGAHRLMELAGFIEQLGGDRIHDTIRHAVEAATSEDRRTSPERPGVQEREE
jgi:anti-anti-sigma regulatory factor